jgi:hypothetical protein
MSDIANYFVYFLGLNAYRGISPFDMPFQRYDKLQVPMYRDATLSLFR